MKKIVDINFTAPIVIKGMRVPYRTSVWSRIVHIDLSHITEAQKNYIILGIGEDYVVKSNYGNDDLKWLILNIDKLEPLLDQLKEVFGLEMYPYNPFGG